MISEQRIRELAECAYTAKGFGSITYDKFDRIAFARMIESEVLAQLTANSERAAEPVAFRYVEGDRTYLVLPDNPYIPQMQNGEWTALYTSPQASQQPVEAIARLNYFFRQIDGTYVFPTPCHPQIRQVLEALIDYATPTNKADLKL